jgi:hypothetical protein
MENKTDGWYNIPGEERLLGLYDEMSHASNFLKAFRVEIRRPLMASLCFDGNTIAPPPYKGKVSKHSLLFPFICKK